MIIDCFYRFRKTAGRKTRYHLEAFAGEYEPLHQPLKKSGEIVIYLSKPCFLTQPKAGKRTADFALNRASHNVSSLFFPDLENPFVAYGDFQHEEDAGIFVIKDGTLEIYVSKGRKNVALTIWQTFVEGDLADEIEQLKKRAIAVESLACQG